MRNLKKVLSVLLVVAMIAMTMVPAFAAESYTYDAQAKALNAIGLFNGVSDTEFDPDLGSALTREQGFALIIRLLGKGADAKALTDADSILAAFEDADTIEPSLKNEVALAVKLGLVVGDGKNVDAKGAMIGNDFATVLLRQLGYEVTADGYATAAATLAEKGGLTAAEVTKFATKELIRDDLVGMAYGSLKATYKTGETVIDKLIADKVVSEDDAIAAGIKEKVTSATSMTAKATGRDTITVTFNGTVDTTKAVLTVKRGLTAITTTTKFADDKKSATLVGASKYSEGEYTITATGITEKELTATVSYEDEKVDKIEFTSDKAVIVPFEKDNDLDEDRWVYVYFKMLNQYGENITDSYNTYSSDFTWSTIVNDDYINFDYAKNGKLLVPVEKVIDKDSEEFVFGQSVPVSVVYNDGEGTVVTASTILTVGSTAGVGEIKVAELYSDTDEELTTSSTYDTYYLILNLKDQYGNELSFDADETLILDDLSVTSSNTSVLKFEEDDVTDYYAFQNLVIDGEDYIALPLSKPNTPKSGSAVVTVISNSTGKMGSYTVDVNDASYAASFTMTKPDVAVIGEKTIIPFTAYDPEGKEVTDIDDLKEDSTGDDEYYVELDTNGADLECFYFQKNPTTGDAQLVFDTSRDSDPTNFEDGDSVTLTATTHPNYKNSSVTIKLKDAKVPESITGISSSYYKKIAEGAFAEFKYDKLILQDNYDRTYPGGEIKNQLLTDLDVNADGSTLYTAGQYRIQVSSSSSKVKVISEYTVGGAVYIGYNPNTSKLVEKAYFYGASEGTATITLQMQENKNYDPTNPAATPDWKNIADADYDFTMSTIDRDDIKSFAVGNVAETYDYGYFDAYDNTLIPNTSNNYGLKKTRTYTSAVSVDGVMADGTKVWISQQILPEKSTLVDGYTVSAGLANKVKSTSHDAAVAGDVYQADIKDKFEFSAKLNDDVDETVTVPFSVVPSSIYFKNVDTVSSSFKVNSTDPVLSSIGLTYNGFAQLSTDGGAIEISQADFDTLAAWADVDGVDGLSATEYTKVLNKIVADAVICKDQYGKEHDAEQLTDNADILNIQPDGSVISVSGDDVEVTVITNSGALTKTFTITIK